VADDFSTGLDESPVERELTFLRPPPTDPAERQSWIEAQKFAHGCWCAKRFRPHEGWCDGKHHARMQACPHENQIEDERGRRCSHCGWHFDPLRLGNR
jgi:hypothetical protein